jgi:chromate transport protein ChrA
MATLQHAHFARNWQDIAASFLTWGVTAYGGPAIMGIMQAELQDKRQWVSKERFVEGLSLVNMLPGAGATQLGIFLGYARGGWWGGLLAGLCFVLQAFCIIRCAAESPVVASRRAGSTLHRSVGRGVISAGQACVERQ